MDFSLPLSSVFRSKGCGCVGVNSRFSGKFTLEKSGISLALKVEALSTSSVLHLEAQLKDRACVNTVSSTGTVKGLSLARITIEGWYWVLGTGLALNFGLWLISINSAASRVRESLGSLGRWGV